jgi:glutamyl-Q tRNA(Asp) synthetase
MIVTRFAPSPTGPLHLGHAFSALFGWRLARRAGGRFLLRIEDIDRTRCRPESEVAIVEDLAWLGIDWDGRVRRQSEHMDMYRAALDRLAVLGVLYPCFCSRKDIRTAASAPHGSAGHLYPGTCRRLPGHVVEARIAAGEPHALRLDAAGAQRLTGVLCFTDQERGRIVVDGAIGGDVVLGRRDFPASYHLCVVVDDAIQEVSLVTRGEDLLEATHTQRLVQALLGLPEPGYAHHRLILNAAGDRLAKRDGAMSILALRQAGKTPSQIRELAGFPD